MEKRRANVRRARRAIGEVPIPTVGAVPVPLPVGPETHFTYGSPVEALPVNPRPSEMVRILSDHPFLHGMPNAFLAPIARASRLYGFERDEFLLRERQLADGLYLILKGKLALEITLPGRPGVMVQTVGPGEVAGWSWLIPPYSSYLDVRALEPTQVVKIDAATLRDILRERPAVGFEFLMRLFPVLAQRLEYAMIQIMNIYGV